MRCGTTSGGTLGTYTGRINEQWEGSPAGGRDDAPWEKLPIGPRLQFQGPCRRYGNLGPRPKLHVETLIDLPLAREISSNGYVWVRERGKSAWVQQLSAYVGGTIVGRCFIRLKSYHISHITLAEGTAANSPINFVDLTWSKQQPISCNDAS